MPKRKLSDRDVPAPPPQSLQSIRLTNKFDHGVVALSRALKTARGFERQKLGRREKMAKTEGGEQKRGTLRRLEEEVQVLKDLDPTITAQKYLFKQLLKTKRIAEAPAFIEFKAVKQISTEAPASPAEANVLARLYKSNPMKAVFPDLMTSIRQVLGLEDTRGEDGKPAGGHKKEGAKKAATDVISDSEGEGGAQARAQLEGDVSDAESADFAQFDGRLAGSDDESDDDEDGGVDVAGRLRDMSISRSPSPDSRPSKKKAKKASAAPATGTTFLPSLQMGGYFSGSESEAENIDEAPRRKNRMGQQARRALWEKKYGAQANHVQKQSQRDKNNRDNGWDVRRGATGGDRGSRGRGGRGGRFGQGDRPQRGPAIKKPEDDKPMHPSWEAAKKAKEQKTASFSGTKVVFD